MPTDREVLITAIERGNASAEGASFDLPTYGDAHKLRFTMYNLLRPIKNAIEAQDMKVLVGLPQGFLRAVNEVEIVLERLTDAKNGRTRVCIRPKRANPTMVALARGLGLDLDAQLPTTVEATKEKLADAALADRPVPTYLRTPRRG